MIRALLLALFALLVSQSVFAIDPTTLPDAAMQARYQSLTHEFRCMQCLNQSIADSPVELAGELRQQVREQVVSGKSDAEIRDYMVARYGEFILFRPRFSARNLWLWLGPGVLLLAGAYIAVRVIRQRTALVAQDDQPLEEDAGR